MLRSALAALTVTLLSQAAFASPVLRAEATVTTPLVTVGDLFTDAGAAAETAVFRAPKPGTSGMVDLGAVSAALARVGITDYQANGLSGVRVTRAASVVDEAMLGQLITDDLTSRGILTQGMTADIVFTRQITPINADMVDQPATVSSLRYAPGAGTFTARFTLAGIDQPLDVSGSIEVMIAVPHIRTTLAAGTVLTADNVEMRPVPLRYVESSGAARLEDVVGMSLARQSREGMMLRPTDVTVPQLIAKNDLVTMYFRKGPLTLTVKGQAVSSATKGGPVQVLNLMSKRIISATAIAPGAVEVSVDPLNVAGL